MKPRFKVKQIFFLVKRTHCSSITVDTKANTRIWWIRRIFFLLRFLSVFCSFTNPCFIHTLFTDAQNWQHMWWQCNFHLKDQQHFCFIFFFSSLIRLEHSTNFTLVCRFSFFLFGLFLYFYTSITSKKWSQTKSWFRPNPQTDLLTKRLIRLVVVIWFS